MSKITLTVKDNRAYYVDEEDCASFSIPAEDSLGLIHMQDIPPIRDPQLFEREIINPSYGRSIRDLAKGMNAASASIIISDATRGVPTHLVSGYIIRELVASGIKYENILFVVALGVHREATEDEILSFIGDEYYGKVHVENHKPHDDASLVEVGVTSFGTPVMVYKAAYECDLHISIGKVELHCFAGFSGGRKSVLPGISSAGTIAANHSFQNLSDINSVPGVLDNNRIHLDMVEAAKFYRLDFTVNFVLNDDLLPAGIFAGEMEAAHSAAVQFLRKYCEVLLPERPDIIVSSTGRPKNIDFYQAVTSLAALTPILTPDIIVVLLCECREGINSIDMMRSFEATLTVEDAESYMIANYEIQMDCALFILNLLKKGIKIIVCSPNLADKDLETMHLFPCQDNKKLMELAYQVCGKENPKVLFYPHPQKSLPIL